MVTWSPAPGWVTVTVTSHQAGTPVSVSSCGCSGGTAGNVTVPPLWASAVTVSTMVPAGAETGIAAHALDGLLSREAALAAIGTSAAATGTAAASRMSKGFFM